MSEQTELDGVVGDALREGWTVVSSAGDTTVLTKRTGLVWWGHAIFGLALLAFIAMGSVAPLWYLIAVVWVAWWIYSTTKKSRLTIYMADGEIVQEINSKRI